jgi:hypothetical protein
MEKQRTCTLCGKTAEQSLFVKDNTKASGYRNKCRECHNNKNVNWRKDHIELNRQIQSEYGKRRRLEAKLNKQN